jgi:hypothetical protein
MIDGPTGHLLTARIHVNASLLAVKQTRWRGHRRSTRRTGMTPPEHIHLPASARPISVRAGDPRTSETRR